MPLYRELKNLPEKEQQEITKQRAINDDAIRNNLHPETNVKRKYKFRGARIVFEPRDFWVGIYWTFANIGEKELKSLKVYVCIVPFFPIVLTWTNSFIA